MARAARWLARPARDERGSAFLMGLTLVMVMTLLGMALFEMSAIEGALARSDVADQQAFYCAEAEVARVRQLYLPAQDPAAALGSQSFEGTLALSNGTYEVRSTAEVNAANQLIRITATCTLPDGRTRTVQRADTREFSATQFAIVAGGFNPATGAQEYLGDLTLSGYGAPQNVGGLLVGGADVVNGDVYASGNVYVRGEATIAGFGSDRPPAVTVPAGKVVTSSSSQFDPMAPGNTGTLAEGPLPVLSNAAGTGAIDEIRAAVTSADGTPRMTGSYKGTTVYNLEEIFRQLGTTSEGNQERNLARPSGCTFGVASTDPKCQIWQDLVILGPRKTTTAAGDTYFFVGLPRSPSAAPQGTSFGTIFAAAVRASAELQQLGFTTSYNSLGSRLDALLGPNPTGSGRVSRLVDFTIGTDAATGESIVRSQPPIFYVNGTWRAEGASDLAYNGRATIVSSKSMVVADNLLSLNGLANVNTSLPPAESCTGGDPASCGLADMLALMAKDDIWIGDADGTVNTVTAILLAGRDVNISDPSAALKGSPNPLTINGAVLAARQAALVRDWADPSAGHDAATCNRPQPPCRPVVFFPNDASCGVDGGCWRFMKLDAMTGALVVDQATPGFADGCVTTAAYPLSPPTCPPRTRRVTHFQLVVNFDGRLVSHPELTPFGLPTGGTKFVGLTNLVWKDCGSRPTCSP